MFTELRITQEVKGRHGEVLHMHYRIARASFTASAAANVEAIPTRRIEALSRSRSGLSPQESGLGITFDGLGKQGVGMIRD